MAKPFWAREDDRDKNGQHTTNRVPETVLDEKNNRPSREFAATSVVPASGEIAEGEDWRRLVANRVNYLPTGE